MKKRHRNSQASKLNEMIQDAIALHQSGRLDEAAAEYKKLLKFQPDNTTLLTYLSAIALHQGNLDETVRIIVKSLQIDPNQSNAHIIHGLALQNLKRFNDALASYDRAVALNPNDSIAFTNRGNTLLDLNEFANAVASYDRAIALDPDLAQAHSNRGLALQALKRLDEAVESYDRAIARNPQLAHAHFNRGNALQELNRMDHALASYDRAIAIAPNYAEAYSSRGIALQKLKRLDDAVFSHNHAITLNPNDPKAHSNRGVTLQYLRRLEDALESYDLAIALDPKYAEAYSNRGNILIDLKRLDEALLSFDRAIALNPKDVEIYCNRANALKILHRFDDAIASYDLAIALNPDCAEANWNKALLKLLVGDYTEGWALYEWGWKCSQRTSAKIFNRPLWLGEQSLSDKTLLIHPEQGLGDYIQCIRYAPLAEQLAAKVILEVPAPLMSVVSTLKGQFTLIEIGQSLPDFDYHCPVMSLPLAFNTTVKTINAQVPYLYANEEKKQVWREKLGHKSKYRVGLVWQGGFRENKPETWGMNERRNIKLAKFSTFSDLDLDFYSLQKGQPAESELQELQAAHWNGPEILDFTAQLHDFSDTAALIENLDLVISVDTSTAHLAAAMGKEVWILNRLDTCWRWLLDRNDSPWYPTVTLFRQAELGNWDSVIQEVKYKLIEKFRTS
jgi:tetratricopeptide (TPR) repeat protein